MKKRLLGMLLFFTLISTAAAQAVTFYDVMETTRFREPILALANAGIIHGHGDGTFRPREALKRAEIVKLILESQDIEIPEPTLQQKTEGCFLDVKDASQWFFGYLCEAKKRDIARGYEDGTFQPGSEVNRAEAIALLCRTQEWSFGASDALQRTLFIDTKTNDWFTPCVLTAKEDGFLDKVTGESRFFLPGMKMKRGEFAEILYRSLLKQGRTFEVPLGEKNPEALVITEAAGETLPQITNFASFQTAVLNKTNEERISRGLSSVTLDNELSQVAQNHSDNMVIHNFFDHIDHEGNSPEDRRLEAGVTTDVGENLAKAPTVESAHEGLMRSPPHRENILTPEWKRMGIGISQDNQGYLYITQLFSINPVTSQDMTIKKQNLLKLINDLRDTHGLITLTENAELAKIAEDWSDEMANLQFFDFTHPQTEETLIDRTKNQFSATLYQAALYESNRLESFETLFEKQPDGFLVAELRKIGIGFALDATGVIILTVIITN